VLIVAVVHILGSVLLPIHHDTIIRVFGDHVQNLARHAAATANSLATAPNRGLEGRGCGLRGGSGARFRAARGGGGAR
jgi:hypothetical protein